MPRNPDASVMKCDLCNLTTRNSFIFKRHRRRCMRDNVSPSDRPLSPESDGLQSEDNEALDTTENELEASGENSPVITEKDGSISLKTKPNPAARGKVSLSGRASPKVEESDLTVLSTSQGDKMTSRLRSQPFSDLDSPGVALSNQSVSPGSSQETPMPEICDAGQTCERKDEAEGNGPVASGSGGDLPPPFVCRNYRCSQCDFFTNKSREFLQHKIDQHRARLLIFACTVCEYASQYKHKLSRHMIHTHNLHLKNEEIMPLSGGTGPGAKRPLTGIHRLGRPRKVVLNKTAPKSSQSLDSLLIRLRTKAKVTDASLSSFFINTSGQSPDEEDLYKCKLCLFTANSKAKVIRHLHACHINARLFRCNLCSYKTYSKIEFYAHKKKHTNKNTTMFKCSECAYATEFRPNFDRHMIQHGSDKPNKCSLCSYATDHEGALKRHVTSHHPNTEENQSLVIAGDECAAAGRPRGDNEDNMEADMEDEEGLNSDGFRCPICSLQYRRCSDLNRHMKSKHSVSRKAFLECNTADDEEEIFEMDDEEFNEMEVDEIPGSDYSDESQPLSELMTKGKQATQMINKKCSYCSYIAKWPSDLRRHMRVHSVVKRFKCSLCWKKYKYLGDLNVHMRRDHEVSPDEELTPQKVSTIAIKKNSPRLFRCPACPFSTKVKVDMDRHSQEHTEEKTYSCRLCQYQTYWRGDMGRHLYRKHPDEVSKDADVKEFFIFRPERRAISKGGKGVLPHGPPEPDGVFEGENKEESPQAAEEETTTSQAEEMIEKEGRPVEDGNEDSISDTLSASDSLSNCSEATMDKDGRKVFKCQLCPFSNTQAYKMKNHMDTHLNLKQFKCPVCGQRSNWKYDVRKHMSSKHPDSSLEVVTLSVEEARATIQDYIANSPNIKRDHHLTFSAGPTAASQKPAMTPPPPPLSSKPSQHLNKKRKAYEYKCSHCPFRSWYRWSVSKHQRDSHEGQVGIGILVKPILISFGEGPGQLQDEVSNNQEQDESQDDSPQPEKNLVSPQKVKREATDVIEMMEEEEEGVEGSCNLYRCAECGKEGSSKGSIKKHYNYIHPNSEVRIISVADGIEFNYYTGLPTNKSVPPSPPLCDVKSVTPKAEAPAPISKMSDPKKHGYVKPFQCSVCGQRSNWKWDIKKHLRAKHPGDFGHVIVLQQDQAKATLPDKSALSPVKEKQLDVSTASSNSAGSAKDSSGSKEFVSPDMPYKSQEMLLGRYRRYKCSGCGYRSNWRTDICRHIERRHKEGGAEVIFMGVEEAKETFMDYHYNPPNTNPHTPGVYSSSSTTGQSPSFKLPSPSKPPCSPYKSPQNPPPITGKVWHCPKCSFMSAIKSHIVVHMQNHGMKPFHCSACGQTSRFRSPIHRHIRKQHGSTDYKAYAKIVIKFSKPSSAQARGLEEGMGAGLFQEAYLCRLCSGNTVETPTKEAMMDHILSEHGSTDASQALKIKKKLGGEQDEEGNGSADKASKEGRAKRYYCTVCPYRTDKRSMLTFHHTYHQPSSQNKYKCKFCPYYVCAPRLLHQHIKWHEEIVDDQATLDSLGWRASAGEKTPPSSPSKRGKVSFESSAKRHICEKCPYTTNSKNDFLYHKQFHRPKPSAEYKCEHCDYWVTHRRLLRQHARLHGEEFADDSVTSSPTKSLTSDASAVLDAVEIAAIKQKMITNKITASLSTSPAVSPMKIAAQCTAGNRPGFVLRDGVYKKLHKCSKCPYTNIRSRNVRLHELMHGWRRSDHALMKCPHCDYYVGAKGLLSHHMKVHNRQYQPDPSDSVTFDLERREKAPGAARISVESEDDHNYIFTSREIPQQHKVDTLLEISRFRKYSCEKCPYASGKRSHFMRHMELHGSRQRHTCQYCDYSVPSVTLLAQHQKIHMMPNQNLLATQSFSNLQHLKEVPADVALASALPPTDTAESVTISVIHDHLELYENDENNALDAEPKKLYRCDRCPYANVRRDHLLTHLRFHMSKSSFCCPYCDYSAPKHQLLTQHIRVHFCPLPELSDWLIENGQSERAQEVNDIDLTQALAVAEKFQHSKGKVASFCAQLVEKKQTGKDSRQTDDTEPPAKKVRMDAKDSSTAVAPQGETTSSTREGSEKKAEPQPSTSAAADAVEATAKAEKDDSNMYICQYCDREFPSSKLLISHEMQHLIGNHFEVTSEEWCRWHPASLGPSTKATEVEEDHQHVAQSSSPPQPPPTSAAAPSSHTVAPAAVPPLSTTTAASPPTTTATAALTGSSPSSTPATPPPPPPPPEPSLERQEEVAIDGPEARETDAKESKVSPSKTEDSSEKGSKCSEDLIDEGHRKGNASVEKVMDKEDKEEATTKSPASVEMEVEDKTDVAEDKQDSRGGETRYKMRRRVDNGGNNSSNNSSSDGGSGAVSVHNTDTQYVSLENDNT